MSKLTWKQLKRRWKRFLKRYRRKVASFVVLIAICIIGYHIQTRPPKIDPSAYGALLHTIAEGESKGNYNAYFRNASNTELRFTDMTIDQVLQWQRDYVKSGQPSSAVGRYQIIRSTLEGLVVQLEVDRSQKFDEAMQDEMAIALMERRGSVAYVDDKLSRDQFAANIAKEWAALPKVIGDNPGQSYYEGDGLNRSRVSIPDIYRAIDQLKNSPKDQ